MWFAVPDLSRINNIEHIVKITIEDSKILFQLFTAEKICYKRCYK